MHAPLTAIANVLKDSHTHLRVEAFSKLPSDEGGGELSRQRAAAIAQYLLKQEVPEDRVTAHGYGDDERVAAVERGELPADTPEQTKVVFRCHVEKILLAESAELLQLPSISPPSAAMTPELADAAPLVGAALGLAQGVPNASDTAATVAATAAAPSAPPGENEFDRALREEALAAKTGPGRVSALLARARHTQFINAFMAVNPVLAESELQLDLVLTPLLPEQTAQVSELAREMNLLALRRNFDLEVLWRGIWCDERTAAIEESVAENAPVPAMYEELLEKVQSSKAVGLVLARGLLDRPAAQLMLRAALRMSKPVVVFAPPAEIAGSEEALTANAPPDLQALFNRTACIPLRSGLNKTGAIRMLLRKACVARKGK